MNSNVFRDPDFRRSVGLLGRRADKVDSPESVVSTFVDDGLTDLMINDVDQIIFGRRGTGKTHLLRMLRIKLTADLEAQAVAVYIDPRTLGSSTELTRTAVSVERRTYLLIRDVCQAVALQLRETIRRGTVRHHVKATRILDSFDDVVSGVESRDVAVKKVVRTEKRKNLRGLFKAGLNSLGLEIGGQGETADGTETEYTTITRDTLNFSRLTEKLNEFLGACGFRLYVLIDEWSSIPPEIQPAFAQFVRRCFLAQPRMTVKIAAIRARSVFRTDNVGIELGSDLEIARDLDDCFVFDRDPEQVIETLSAVLYAHMFHAMGSDLVTRVQILDGSDLIRRLFDNDLTFVDLVIASEGVIRDFLALFCASFDAVIGRRRKAITKELVRQVAVSRYQKEKRSEVRPELRQLLQEIADTCLAARARSFRLPTHADENSVLMELADQRVIHVLQRELPIEGVENDIYSLDFGCYAHLIDTPQCPQLRPARKNTVNSVPLFFHGDRWLVSVPILSEDGAG